MPVLVGLILLAALAAGLVGAWITLETVLGGQRRFAERLERNLRPQAPEPVQAEAAAPGALARLIETRVPGVRRRLQAAGAPFTAAQLLLGSAGLFLLLLLAASLLGLAAPVALGLAVGCGLAGPILLVSWLAQRRRNRFALQMPQAVDLIARSLQAGHPVTTALGVAARQMPAPIGPEFQLVMAEIALGQDRDTALRNLLQRFPIPELRMFAASMEVTRETGGDLSEVFLKLGETLRAKAQLRKKVAALSAEGRLTFWVVSVLPLAVVAGLLVLQPDYYRSAVHAPHFLPMIAMAPILWALGAVTIWRMINFRI